MTCSHNTLRVKDRVKDCDIEYLTASAISSAAFGARANSKCSAGVSHGPVSGLWVWVRMTLTIWETSQPIAASNEPRWGPTRCRVTEAAVSRHR